MLPSSIHSKSARILGKKEDDIFLSTFFTYSFYLEGFLGLKEHNHKFNIRKQYGNLQRVITASDGHYGCDITDAEDCYLCFKERKSENPEYC